MSYLSSPSERETRGINSPLPERYGVDFLVIGGGKKFGIQRKKFPEDFFASESDGRLGKELIQMQALDYAVVVIEGRATWTSDGFLMDSDYNRWSKPQLRNLLRSVRLRFGVDVEWSEDTADTLNIVDELESWVRKPTHNSLVTRHKEDMKDDWGHFSSLAFTRFFLQAIPGIGAVTAEEIFKHFGKCPLEWTVSETEMGEVFGVGKKTIDNLFGVLK